MQLPKHIADMCGIVDAQTKVQIPSEEYQAIKKEFQDDGVIQISWRGSVVGWIMDTKLEHYPNWRALTPAGKFDRFYTGSDAMNWLIEEAF